jgi:hypothetical protein
VREFTTVPKLAKVGPYRCFFYSNESGEPAHVHIRRERKLAKFWLQPVELADSKRFAAHELREIEQIVQDRRIEFLEAWNEYFGN